MHKRLGKHPCWSTSSLGETLSGSPADASALGEHLALCRHLTGRLFRVHCLADQVRGYMAVRFATTSLGLVLLTLGVSWLVW